MNKSKQLQQLWQDLASERNAEHLYKKRNGKLTNIGFVNQYAKHEFIPNKWFDWENRANAKIMIIGQDWGPYIALKPYVERYNEQKDKPGFNLDDFMFDTFSSRTERFIMKAIETTYKKHFNNEITHKTWNDIFFTVAIMFTRQGKNFRGNDFFDEKFGIEVSFPYLKRQIDVLKPKIVIALGKLAYRVVAKYYNLEIQNESISKVVERIGDGAINVNNTIIIPIFHPASHTDPKIQIKGWEKMWKYYN